MAGGKLEGSHNTRVECEPAWGGHGWPQAGAGMPWLATSLGAMAGP